MQEPRDSDSEVLDLKGAGTQRNDEVPAARYAEFETWPPFLTRMETPSPPGLPALSDGSSFILWGSPYTQRLARPKFLDGTTSPMKPWGAGR